MGRINIMLALPDDDHSWAKLPSLNKIRIQDVFKEFTKISRFGPLEFKALNCRNHYFIIYNHNVNTKMFKILHLANFLERKMV